MKNEENKKTWETPEIVDLDVNENTKDGEHEGEDGDEWGS